MLNQEHARSAVYPVPPGTPAGRCRGAGCGRPIYFVKTAAGKSMPVDANGAPHWVTCPNSREFKARAQAERRLREVKAGQW